MLRMPNRMLSFCTRTICFSFFFFILDRKRRNQKYRFFSLPHFLSTSLSLSHTLSYFVMLSAPFVHRNIDQREQMHAVVRNFAFESLLQVTDDVLIRNFLFRLGTKKLYVCLSVCVSVVSEKKFEFALVIRFVRTRWLKLKLNIETTVAGTNVSLLFSDVILIRLCATFDYKMTAIVDYLHSTEKRRSCKKKISVYPVSSSALRFACLLLLNSPKVRKHLI